MPTGNGNVGRVGETKIASCTDDKFKALAGATLTLTASQQKIVTWWHLVLSENVPSSLMWSGQYECTTVSSAAPSQTSLMRSSKSGKKGRWRPEACSRRYRTCPQGGAKQRESHNKNRGAPPLLWVTDCNSILTSTLQWPQCKFSLWDSCQTWSRQSLIWDSRRACCVRHSIKVLPGRLQGKKVVFLKRSNNYQTAYV